ncbi:quinoprotein dehydrogenase-associated SoxYZ-like carrier [Fulvimarina sp. 2208YS6-2-32]|uniref:Quinoprotein dehydrogenase-associated SoxYZ-like carrier n=1 Tax=Fulvimarina uroteuthidis TaxID=3098149 RepID=A0ABU5HYT3_9HYPH|nr:quinoprotein dehydrogenase-associated SoxYZ-like carrier [Fulvimarina sp. 2208YS6-2-32]MDY8108232.1 quinoprotein dehydrogenase-associated SoxYZ-like carrier [Fulvimarina sp. 2208YS6-2-32]
MAFRRRLIVNTTLATLLASALVALPRAGLAESDTQTPEAAAAAADSAWSDLKGDLFGDKELIAGTDAVSLDAPSRAADPAVVPMTISLDPAKDIRKVTLVIDENPSPVAATFDIAEGAGLTELTTRVRVNAYTDVHVVAEDAEGNLYVTQTFVKAAGGCAAPAAKDPELAAREMGKMKLRSFGKAEGSSTTREAQLQIRHPNNSGLQKDQVTLLYIPAHFVDEIAVSRGGETLFTMTGGISISEDPNFRFNYAGETEKPFEVKATDTNGNVFEETFPVTPA